MPRNSLSLLFASVLLITRCLADQVCNGYAELCSRSYGNVTFIGAHDSAFVSASSALTANQHFDVTRQLDDGIRLLQSQGHKLNGSTDPNNIELCHTECEILDAGPLSSYLSKVKSWLDANPDEVVTILFTNQDGIDVTVWDTNFKNAGLSDLAYVPTFSTTPSSTSAWPTLGSILSAGKQLVIFMDSDADTSKVNYILPEFTYIWETPFDQTDNSFPCTIDRPPSLKGHTPTGQMSLVNHFLDTQLTAGILIPDVDALNVTNAVNGTGSLGLQAQNCAALWGAYPNFLLVDYYDVYNGSVFQVAAKLNGVPYQPSQSVLTDKPASTTGGAGVPSSASAMKVLPVFIIMQLGLTVFTVGGAYWLVHDDNSAKYDRLQDRFSSVIPAKKGHQKFDSIASVGSEGAGYATELESGPAIRRDGRTDSTADLTDHAALMGRGTPRHSFESVRDDDDDAELASLRRVLDDPTPRRGYLEHRRDSLFIS